MVKTVNIEWLSDYYGDCETCGGSWADGARVSFDGEVVLECIPSAHCTGSDHWTEQEIYEKILKLLGVEEVIS